MLGLELKSTIEGALNQVLESGASNAIMVNPEGFILMSAGEFDNIDETAAVSFVAMVPLSLKALNEFSKKMIKNVLKKSINFNEIIIHQLQFAVNNRKYVGIYVEGYAIIANVTKNSTADKTRVALVKAVASIIGLLRRLRESLALPTVVEEGEEAVLIKPEGLDKIKPELRKNLVDRRQAYEKIEKIVNELRKELEGGNWKSTLDGFTYLRKVFVALIDLHPELRDDNVLRAILRWIVKTEARLSNIVRSGIEGTMDASRISVLDRGLRQLLQHTSRILLRGK